MEYTSAMDCIVWLEFLRRKSLLRPEFPDIVMLCNYKRFQEYYLNFSGVSLGKGSWAQVYILYRNVEYTLKRSIGLLSWAMLELG